MDVPLTGPGDHPVDRYAPLTAGLVRLEPPPRRVGPLLALRLIDADVPGRPLIRRATLTLFAATLGLAVLAPDLFYARQPVVAAAVISAERWELPGPLAAASEALPFDPLGHVATFRLPSGDVATGPVSADEYRLLEEGAATLDVHLLGGAGRRGRPASGLFPIPRIAIAACLGLLTLLTGVGTLVRLRRGLWMARLARAGVGVVGRPTEIKSQRLMRGEEPVGWRYDLYYDFRATDGVREGVIHGFYSDRHVPFVADRPLKILYMPGRPERSLPLDLLPGVAHE